MLSLSPVTLDIIQVTANCIVKTRNHDFQRKRAMQHCCEILSSWYNIVFILLP